MDSYIVDSRALEDYCARLFVTQGVPEDEAKIVSNHLVEAELCGVTSHGVSRAGIYMKRLNAVFQK